MPCAVDSTLDVAFWFVDRAMADREYLQPQKLHRLMYLAQAYFAVANYGRKLMPSIFVAEEAGPIEPTIYRLFEEGRPAVQPRRVTEAVDHFLDSIWRRFGAHSTEHLSKVIRAHPPFRQALQKGLRAEISLDSMRHFYGGATAAGHPDAPSVQQVMRPRLMRSHTGQPVAVTKWMPPVKQPAKK